MKKYILAPLVITLIFVGLASVGPMMSHTEQPSYHVISSDGPIEIRQYAPMIIAQVTTEGSRETAIKNGFEILADYIFGNNTVNDKIDMTTPVTQETHQKIAMTRPVTQQKTHKISMTVPVTQTATGLKWNIHFVMPKKYTLETLPKPNNDQIIIKTIPAKKYIAIRFSGTASQENIMTHEKKLNDTILKKQITPRSLPSYAFYNPPWTLPFLRRNEILIEI